MFTYTLFAATVKNSQALSAISSPLQKHKVPKLKPLQGQNKKGPKALSITSTPLSRTAPYGCASLSPFPPDCRQIISYRRHFHPRDQGQ